MEELDSIDGIDNIPFGFENRIIHPSKKPGNMYLDERLIFSNALKKDIRRIAINPRNIILYGSANIASLISVSGDLDFWEIFNNPDFNKIANELSNLIRKFKNDKKSKFFIEMKCGLNIDLILDIGYLESDKIIGYNKDKIIAQINKSKYKNELVNELKGFIKLNPTMEEWIILYDKIRLLYTLRWTEDEIIKKKKILKTKTLNLVDALQMNSMTKIDTMQMLNCRLTGIDNFIDVSDEYGKQPSKRFENTLRFNAVIMYNKKRYFKMMKRIFVLERIFFKGKSIIKNIWSFLLSDVGKLSRINTDLSGIVILLDVQNKRVPIINTIKNELDGLIDKLAEINIIDFDIEKIDIQLNKLINMNKTNTKKDVINFKSILESMIEYIKKIIERETEIFLRQINLFPLPKFYYPENTKNIMKYEYITKINKI